MLVAVSVMPNDAGAAVAYIGMLDEEGGSSAMVTGVG